MIRLEQLVTRREGRSFRQHCKDLSALAIAFFRNGNPVKPVLASALARKGTQVGAHLLRGAQCSELFVIHLSRSPVLLRGSHLWKVLHIGQ